MGYAAAMRRSLIPFAFLLLALPQAAAGQAVEVTPLAAPDYFSAGARDTGLPSDLWRGASARTARTVLPLLAEKPLSPAARALARRVLGTGARGPEGVGDDPAMAARRAQALTALGDAAGAVRVLDRAAGLERDPALAQAAAESALLAGDDAAACRMAEALTVGRDEVYWLRLRAFCQALAGETAAAQLTLDLAQAAGRDATFGRLMTARLLAAGDPGKASLRNGLDYALSRNLGLDLLAVEAAAPVAAALTARDPEGAHFDFTPPEGPVGAAMAAIASGDVAAAGFIRGGLVGEAAAGVLDLAVLDAMLAIAEGRPGGPTLDRLVERANVGEAASRNRARDAALILAGWGAPLGADARGDLAALAVPPLKTPTGRLLAMDAAAGEDLAGETALLALWTAAEAGAGGPAAADRAWIVRALRQAGLEADARNFALEGLLALK